jgi:23S rRNA pseudouridine2605 synthase
MSKFMKKVEMRLQKYLSECGITSRRKAEELIKASKVKVNGHIANIGDKITIPTDIITINGEKVEHKRKYVYAMLNKPRGYVTTLSDELGRKCVADLINIEGVRLYPIGRLDRNSEGLLLFTNDGAFANMIAHPSMHIAKTYRVTLHSDINEEQLATFASGMVIEGVKTAPCDVTVLIKDSTRVVLEIVLYEGRNRQIRKMCEELNLDVARLKRISVGPIMLGRLEPGKWRLLDDKEIALLKIAADRISDRGGKVSFRTPELMKTKEIDQLSALPRNKNGKIEINESKVKKYRDKNPKRKTKYEHSLKTNFFKRGICFYSQRATEFCSVFTDRMQNRYKYPRLRKEWDLI